MILSDMGYAEQGGIGDGLELGASNIIGAARREGAHPMGYSS